MGVYIRGMEMPEGCSYCMFRHTSFMTGIPICTLINEAIPDGVNWDERLPECKMIEVPEPHGRLIDAEQLKETLDYYIREAGWSDEINKALNWVKDEFINSEQTIIPASEEGKT